MGGSGELMPQLVEVVCSWLLLVLLLLLLLVWVGRVWVRDRRL